MRRTVENRVHHVAYSIGRMGVKLRDDMRGYTDEYAQRVRDLIVGNIPITDDTRDRYKAYQLHRVGVIAGYRYPSSRYTDGIFLYTIPASLRDDPQDKVHEAVETETARLEKLSPQEYDAEVIERAKAWARARHIKWE